jgi:hypothetical protein
MRHAFATLLLLSTFSLLFAKAIIIEWKAEPQQNKIVLQWKSSSEENVQKYVVQRSNDNNHFSDIGEIEAKGAGYVYRFEDEDLGIINSIFYYRLKIIDQDDSFEHTDVLTVIPNISSISRTWGSIKALFR